MIGQSIFKSDGLFIQLIYLYKSFSMTTQRVDDNTNRFEIMSMNIMLNRKAFRLDTYPRRHTFNKFEDVNNCIKIGLDAFFLICFMISKFIIIISN